MVLGPHTPHDHDHPSPGVDDGDHHSLILGSAAATTTPSACQCTTIVTSVDGHGNRPQPQR